MSTPDVVTIFDLSNEEFLARYAAPGDVLVAEATTYVVTPLSG